METNSGDISKCPFHNGNMKPNKPISGGGTQPQKEGKSFVVFGEFCGKLYHKTPSPFAQGGPGRSQTFPRDYSKRASH